MALAARSLFLYGFEVTELNQNIDFRSAALETPRQATLRLGFYSLTSLCEEIARAMHIVDQTRTFTITVDRTLNGGLENRVTIATSGSHFEILFSSGPRAASSIASLIGFAATDRTGALTYTGTATAGTALVPGASGVLASQLGYNFLSPDFSKELFGSVNVSASGLKEAIVFNIQSFWEVEFKYQTASKVTGEWMPFLKWCIQQRLIEFTPDIGSPSTFYEGTLEKTALSGKGLGYKMTEMLPTHPNYYKTGLMTFRVSL